MARRGRGRPAIALGLSREDLPSPVLARAARQPCPQVARSRLAPGEPGHDHSPEQPAVGSEALEFSQDSEAMVRAMFDRTRAVRMQTAALSVTPAELTFIDELAPLLGDTSLDQKVRKRLSAALRPAAAGHRGAALRESGGLLPRDHGRAAGVVRGARRGAPEEEQRGRRSRARWPTPEEECPPRRWRATTSGRRITGTYSTPESRSLDPARRVSRFSFRS